MKTGPNRRIVSPDVFLLLEEDRTSLGKFRQIDFSLRSEAEREILELHVWYRSYLQSEQSAPTHKAIEKKVTDLISSVDAALSGIRTFTSNDENAQSELEFNAAISDLLRDHDLERAEMKDTMEEASDILRRLEMYLRSIRSALAERLREGTLHISSSRAIRTEYYQRLHKVLVHHGLSDGFGQNSLIVQLIMRLEGAENEDAMIDSRLRKELARDVKLAVNPSEGA
jgi:hypothetical protein